MQFWPLDEYQYYPNNKEVIEKMSCSNCSLRVTDILSRFWMPSIVVILRAKLSGGIIIFLFMVKKNLNYYFGCFTSFTLKKLEL